MAKTERSLAREGAFGWLERSPFAELFDSSTRMNRLLGEFFGERGLAGMPALPLDVTETDRSYVLNAEIPGVDKKDLTIECRDGMLSIHGEKRSQREENKEKARLLERTYGAFSRSLALPDDADVEQVSASFRDGVLRVEIQKKAGAKSRSVVIKG